MKKIVSVPLSGLIFLLLSGGCLNAAESELTVDNLTVQNTAKFHGTVEVMSQNPYMPTNGLKLYYSFIDNTAPVPDQSGNGNTGVITSATWTSAGKTNGAYVFDGVNDYITSSANVYPGINYSNSFTMAFWMYTDPDCGTWKMPFQLDALPNYSFFGGFYANAGATGVIYFGVGKQGYAWSSITANVGQTGVWQYIVGTFSNRAMCLYVDGVLVASGTSTITDSTASNPNIVVGAQRYVNLFKGKVDEPRFYNRALTSSEVDSMYAFYTANNWTNKASLHVENLVANNGIIQGSTLSTNVFMGSIGVGTANPASGSALDVAGNARVQGTNVVGAMTLGGQTRTNWPAGAETWAQYPASADVQAGNRTVTVGNLIVNSNATFNNSLSLMGTIPSDNTSGLVLFYDFASNTTPVPDLSGYGHSGTRNGATWVAGGWTNGAYSFDATNDWIETVSTAALSPTNQLTILAWIKLDIALSNKYPMIVTKNPSISTDTAQSGNYEFRVNNNGVLYFSSQYSPTASQNAYGVTRVDNFAWHMVGVTVSASNKLVNLYVDGKLDKSQVMGSRPISYTNAEPVRIGRKKNGNYFDGLIDEVRIYNRALTPAEVAQEYQYYTQQKNAAVITADSFKQSGYTQTNIFMGNVGIGTNTATNALNVAGSVSATYFFGNGSKLTSLAGGNIANASITGAKLANLTVTSNKIANLTITSNQIANATVNAGKLYLPSIDPIYVNANGDAMTGALHLPVNGLNVGSNQMVAANGNIGVGTDNPSEKLHVAGNVRVDGRITQNTGNGAVVLTDASFPAASNAPSLSTIIGRSAYYNSTYGESSTLIGAFAGACACLIDASTFVGMNAGAYSTNLKYSTVIGYYAGVMAQNSQYAVMNGQMAGSYAKNCTMGVYLGSRANWSGETNYCSVFIGAEAGERAINCTRDVFIGHGAGYYNPPVTNSVALGFYTIVAADDTVVLGKGCDVVVGGTQASDAKVLLSRDGSGSFAAGISHIAPLGDLGMGVYTNGP